MRGSSSFHGSCAARHGSGVLLLGGSGSGKSDLLLRLIDRGFGLVAYDRVLVEAGQARPPPVLAGLIEVRGLGLLRMDHVAPVTLGLVVALDDSVPGAAAGQDRLPEPGAHPVLGLPMLRIAAFAPSAALRIEIGLDCILGRRRLAVGGLHDPAA